MRVLREILIIVLSVAVAVVSVVGFMCEFPASPALFEPVSRTGKSILAAWRPDLLWLWVAMFLAAFAVLLLTIFRSRRGAHIEVQLADGKVVILDSAIKKYVRTAMGQVQGIIAQQIVLRQTRGGLHVDIYAKVRTNERLAELELKVMQCVRDALSQDLGIRAIAGVHVHIRDFEVNTRPVAAGPEPAPAAEPPPPVYTPPPPRVAEERPIPTPVTEPAKATTFSPPDNVGFLEEEPQGAKIVLPVEPAMQSTDFEPEAQTVSPDSVRKRGFFSRWRKDKEPAGEVLQPDEPATPTEAGTPARSRGNRRFHDAKKLGVVLPGGFPTYRRRIAHHDPVQTISCDAWPGAGATLRGGGARGTCTDPCGAQGRRQARCVHQWRVRSGAPGPHPLPVRRAFAR